MNNLSDFLIAVILLWLSNSISLGLGHYLSEQKMLKAEHITFVCLSMLFIILMFVVVLRAVLA